MPLSLFISQYCTTDDSRSVLGQKHCKNGKTTAKIQIIFLPTRCFNMLNCLVGLVLPILEMPSSGSFLANFPPQERHFFAAVALSPWHVEHRFDGRPVCGRRRNLKVKLRTFIINTNTSYIYMFNIKYAYVMYLHMQIVFKLTNLPDVLRV